MESATQIDTPEARRKEYYRLWHLKNRERRLRANKERRAANPEKYKAMDREYAKRADPEKVKAAQKRYWRRHPELRRKLSRQWRLNNPEKHRAMVRASYQRRKEKVAAYNREYHELHKERIRAQGVEYRRLHAAERSARQKVRFDAIKHLPEVKAKRQLTARKSYQKHKSKISKRHKQWWKDHRHMQWFYRMKRRALVKKATINLKAIKEWMKQIKSKRIVTCYYCLRPVSTDSIHFDHIVALSKGGPHSVENLCVSCEPCNLQKGAKPIRAWVKIGQQTLEL